MNPRRRLHTLVFAFILPIVAVASFSAQAQLKVGVIASATGPTAAVGIPQKNSAALLPKKIAGLDVEYTVVDDGSDSSQSVALVKKLLTEQVDAIIGPSGSPNAMAALQFIADAKTPMLAPVGTTAVVLPMTEQKRWVFKTTQNDALICEALVAHMVKKGVKTVGFIGFKDPYGENWHKVFSSIAEPAGIKLIATEYYLRTDSSVTGQALKLIAAKPDAVLVAGVGGPGVLPQTTLRDQGYKAAIYQTHGVATDDFIRLGKDKVEGTVLAAGPMLVIDEIADSNPIKKVAQAYIGAYEKQFGQKPATFGANTWDSGLILQRAIPIAIKAGKPGTEGFRSALRDAIEREREVVGCQGVFNMSPTNHNGMDERARVLVTVRDGKFRLLPE